MERVNGSGGTSGPESEVSAAALVSSWLSAPAFSCVLWEQVSSVRSSSSWEGACSAKQRSMSCCGGFALAFSCGAGLAGVHVGGIGSRTLGARRSCSQPCCNLSGCCPLVQVGKVVFDPKGHDTAWLRNAGLLSWHRWEGRIEGLLGSLCL